MTADDDPWERHAQWWQDGFTEGADPEYEEQILPLAAAELAGARGCSTSAAARADRRLAAGLDGVERRRRRRPDVDPDQRRRRAGGRDRASSRAGGRGLPFADASFDAVVACLVFEHIDAVDEAIAEVGRVLEPGGRFFFFLNHPLLQTPGSGWIDDQILDPPEQYWRIGPYLDESVTIEEVERACTSASSTARCRATSTRWPPAAHRADARAGAAARVPRPGRRSTQRRGDRAPAACYLRRDGADPDVARAGHG